MWKNKPAEIAKKTTELDENELALGYPKKTFTNLQQFKDQDRA